MQLILRLLFVLICLSSIVHAQTEPQTPKLQIFPDSHTKICNWLAFSADGNRLLTIGADNLLLVWDVEDSSKPVLEQRIALPLMNGMDAAAYSRIGSRDLVAVAGTPAAGSRLIQGDVLIIDLTSGLVDRVLRAEGSAITCLGFTQNGEILITGSEKSLREWRLDDDPEPEERIVGESNLLSDRGVAYLGTSDKEFVSVDAQGKPSRWLREGGDCRLTEEDALTSDIFGKDDRVGQPRGSQSNGWLFRKTTDTYPDIVSATSPKRLGVTDADDVFGPVLENPFGFLSVEDDVIVYKTFEADSSWGSHYAEFGGHDDQITAVAVSPKVNIGSEGGATRVVASVDRRGQDVQLWDASTAEKLGQTLGIRPILFVGVSKDGSRVGYRTVPAGYGQPTFNAAFNLFDPEEDLGFAPIKLEDEEAKKLQIPATLDGYYAKERNKQTELSLHKKEAGSFWPHIKAAAGESINCHSFFKYTNEEYGVIVGSTNDLAAYPVKRGAEGPRTRRAFIGHGSGVSSLAVDHLNRRLVSGGEDGTIRIWKLPDTATGLPLRPLLNIFPAADGRWVAWTPEGYFKSSHKGGELIGWAIMRANGLEITQFRASQFRERLDFPELINNVIKQGGTKAALAELNDRKVPIEPSQIANHAPPIVRITSPKEGYSVKIDRVTVQFEVENTSSADLKGYEVLIDGRTWLGAGTKKAMPADPVERQTQLRVPPGSHEISVRAWNDMSESLPSVVTVHREAQSAPNLHVLSVGVSAYEDEELVLDYAVADAKDVAEAFSDQLGRHYKTVDTNILLDAEVTSEQLIGALRQIQTRVAESAKAGNQDVVFVFLSGHGQQRQGHYYFAPVDSDGTANTGIKWDAIRSILSTLPAKVVLVLDTCHSGSTVGLDAIVKEATDRENGIVILTASGGFSPAIERKEWGHGAFTLALLEVLNNRPQNNVMAPEFSPDLNKDGRVDLIEVNTYISKRVQQLTDDEQLPRSELGQVPNFTLVSFENNDGKTGEAKEQDIKPPGTTKGQHAGRLTIKKSSLKEELRGLTKKKLSKALMDIYSRELKNFHPAGNIVTQTGFGEAVPEFLVSKMKGAVSGDSLKWERLTFSFSQDFHENEVTIMCWLSGLHKHAAGAEKEPAAEDFESMEGAIRGRFDFRRELKAHVGEFAVKLSKALEQ